MSHVDDGTLHAYLDGELTPVERARLEAHVAECAACENRLDEERALIERASGLLGLAQPPERAAPPLHELRRPSVVWRLRVPVAWAATVLLALGLGYYAGDRTSMSVAPEQVAMYSADSSAAQEARPNDRLGLRATPPPLGYSSPRAQAPAPTRPLAWTERKEGERQPTALESAAVVTGRDSILFGTAAASGVISIRTRDTGAANAVPAPAPAAPPPTARAALPQRALEEVDVRTRNATLQREEARRTLVATEWPIIRRGPARQILGAEPMGVPGLAVRNIRRSPSGEIVMVEQAIDSVTVIQLFQQRVESDNYRGRSFAADSLRSATAPTERLARFIGGVRVEIAGPLSADSLNRLLEQVKPIGP
ncbi:MAG TPA: zf-HC2 domain-containing protein [Gemmatimonadales bacterium]|jgi:hypothetical protein|nr:zf-HC2 domain-containing protein [Gemmatimonadales bacterium]